MTKAMVLVLLVVVKSCAAIEIYSPEVGGILPHRHYSYANDKINDSPILKSLYHNQ